MAGVRGARGVRGAAGAGAGAASSLPKPGPNEYRSAVSRWPCCGFGCLSPHDVRRSTTVCACAPTAPSACSRFSCSLREWCEIVGACEHSSSSDSAPSRTWRTPCCSRTSSGTSRPARDSSRSDSGLIVGRCECSSGSTLLAFKPAWISRSSTASPGASPSRASRCSASAFERGSIAGACEHSSSSEGVCRGFCSAAALLIASRSSNVAPPVARCASSRECGSMLGWRDSSDSASAIAERSAICFDSACALSRSSMRPSRPGISETIRSDAAVIFGLLATSLTSSSCARRSSACFCPVRSAILYSRLATSPSRSRISSAETSLISGVACIPTVSDRCRCRCFSARTASALTAFWRASSYSRSPTSPSRSRPRERALICSGTRAAAAVSARCLSCLSTAFCCASSYSRSPPTLHSGSYSAGGWKSSVRLFSFSSRCWWPSPLHTWRSTERIPPALGGEYWLGAPVVGDHWEASSSSSSVPAP